MLLMILRNNCARMKLQVYVILCTQAMSFHISVVLCHGAWPMGISRGCVKRWAELVLGRWDGVGLSMAWRDSPAAADQVLLIVFRESNLAYIKIWHFQIPRFKQKTSLKTERCQDCLLVILDMIADKET